jgi:hypothetical protein
MKDVGWHGDTLKADGHVFLVQPRDCEEFATANDAAIQDVREEMATPLRASFAIGPGCQKL